MNRRSSRLTQREQRAVRLADEQEGAAIRSFLEAALAEDAPIAPAAFALFDVHNLGVSPLPLPAPEDQEDFDLPQEWTKHTARFQFRMLKHNQYRAPLQRPSLSADKIPSCGCKAGNGCGDGCVNLGLFMECPVGTCHATPDGGYDCGNSRLQLRQFVEAEVFETADRGFGLRAKQLLGKGALISEYLGEVITSAECMARMGAMEQTDDFYFAGLGGGLILDAQAMGSEARFANHSCDPNAELQKWHVLGEPKIALVAIADIEEGEEITYNYNYHMDGLEEQLQRQICRCGARNCSGFIGGKVRLSAREAWIARADSMLASMSERPVRLEAVKAHIARSEQPDVQVLDGHPSLEALKELCAGVAMWQARVKASLQAGAAELRVADAEALMQEGARKPKTEEHAMLHKLLERCKQLSKQVSAVYQQVMGDPLTSNDIVAAKAGKPHKQQLHWEYAVQLLKELDGLLPMRLDSAHIIMNWMLTLCQPAVNAAAQLIDASCSKDVDMQNSKSYLINLITTVFSAYDRDPSPLVQVVKVAEVLQNRIDLLLQREMALSLPPTQDSGISGNEAEHSDLEKLFCYCRLPERSTCQRTMVQCGSCDDWFHPECAAIQPQDIPRNVDFMCPLCAHLEHMPCNFGTTQLVAWQYQKPRKLDKGQQRSQLFPPYLLSSHELQRLAEQLLDLPIINSPLHASVSQAQDYIGEWQIRVHASVILPTDWGKVSSPHEQRDYIRVLLSLFYEPIILQVAPTQEMAELRAHIWALVTCSFLAGSEPTVHKPTIEELDGMLREGKTLPEPAPAVARLIQSRLSDAANWMQQLTELKLVELPDQSLEELATVSETLRVDLSADFAFVRFRSHCLLRFPPAPGTSSEVYCWCQEEDDGRPMVCCDQCQNWFHGDCVGIHRKATLKSMKEFHCIACCDTLGKAYPYHWQSGSEKLLRKTSTKWKRKVPDELGEMHEATGACTKIAKAASRSEAPPAIKQDLARPARLPRLPSTPTAVPIDDAVPIPPPAEQPATAPQSPVPTQTTTTNSPLEGAVPISFAPGYAYPMSTPNCFYYPQPAPTAASVSIAKDQEALATATPLPLPTSPWMCPPPAYGPVFPYGGYWMMGPAPAPPPPQPPAATTDSGSARSDEFAST